MYAVIRDAAERLTIVKVGGPAHKILKEQFGHGEHAMAATLEEARELLKSISRSDAATRRMDRS